MIFNSAPFESLREAGAFLSSELSSHKLSHAYLFEGIEGTGKRTAARAFAQAVLCGQQDCAPCGVCPSCRAFEANSHPDAVILRPQDGKKSISVEEVRELIRDAYTKPFMGKKKVYTIEAAQLLTQQAQNALLKLLEEPPAYALFLLLCENSTTIISTVLSRARLVRFQGARTDELIGFLKDKFPSADAASIAACAGGSIGQALALAQDPQINQLQKEAIKALSDVLAKDEAGIFRTIKFLEEKKERVEFITEFWSSLCRDAVLQQWDRNAYITNQNFLPAVLSLSSRMSLKGLLRIQQYIAQMRQMTGKYINLKEAGYYLLLAIREEIYG